MIFVEDSVTLSFCPRKYSGPDGISRFCVYGYIREEDDDHGPAGSVRYVGEGKSGRPKDKHRVRVPADEYIVIFQDNLEKKQATSAEEKLISFYGRIVNGSGILENKAPKAGGSTVGMVTVRDTDGKVHHVSVDNPDYTSGKLVSVLTGVNKGIATVVDTRTGKTCQVSVDDTEYKAGVYVSVQKGYAVVRDKETGSTKRMSINAPEYKSDRYVDVRAKPGTIVARDTTTGENFRVSVDDPRLSDGSMVHVAKGTVLVRDPDTDKVFRVSVNDSRYKSGELPQALKGRPMPVKEYTCPVCGKVGKGRVMFRHHFDRCKMNK
jgi:hypothetical protein